jgi:hypothetical protein
MQTGKLKSMKYSTIALRSITAVCFAFLLLPGCAGAPEPVEPLPPEPVAQPEPEPPVQDNSLTEKSEDFVVTMEVYQQTFEDIEAFIQNLNDIIRNEDFDAWRSFLTDEYITYYSDNAVLKGISDELKNKYRYDLRLRTLKDYFLYIVVGSRQEASLEEIEFIDETHLLAYSIVNETPVILYYLANTDGEWKIARWQQ